MRALGAEEAPAVEADAVSIWEVIGPPRPDLLPEWYMPAAVLGPPPVRRWWRVVALVLIVAFVAINAYGLCSTYGPVTLG